jgi:hypothetical protein
VASDHRLEEPRRLGHLPLQFFDFAVVDVYDYVAVSFDAGYMMNVDIHIAMHL